MPNIAAKPHKMLKTYLKNTKNALKREKCEKMQLSSKSAP